MVIADPPRSPADDQDGFDAKIRQLRRRRAASIAAYAMHARHPDAARINGSLGGRARMKQVPDASAWMRWVARKRWYGGLAGPAPSHVFQKGENPKAAPMAHPLQFSQMPESGTSPPRGDTA